MFESVIPDPAADGLRRAAHIFYVIAVMIPLAAAMRAVIGYVDGRPLDLEGAAVNILFAGLAYATARGIENQKPWGKWLGYALGTIELAYFPIGTVVGIAIWIYLVRAARGGLFKKVKGEERAKGEG
jgi:hypothetical protein